MKFSAWPASGSWINMHKDWLHLAEHGWHGIWSMDHFMSPNDSHENPVSESFTNFVCFGNISVSCFNLKRGRRLLRKDLRVIALM